MRTIDRIIIHHTASPETTTPAQVESWHKARGFRTIGYHRLLYRGSDGHWQVHQGRADAEVGAHDAGENGTSIGICVAGDYTQRPLDSAVEWLLASIVAGYCRRYQVPVARVRGHGEDEPADTPTRCPGYDCDRVRGRVDWLLRMDASNAALVA